MASGAGPTQSSPDFRALLGEAKPRACSLEGVNELNVFQQEP